MPENDGPKIDADVEIPPQVWAEIQRALKEIRFGTIEIVVHDSAIVQVERREKIRVAGKGKPPHERDSQ